MNSKIISILLLAVFCFAAVSAKKSYVKKGCIQIFDHSNYKGKSAVLCSTTTYSKFFAKGGWNDKVSSACAGVGANWRLYQHSHFRGTSRYISGGSCVKLSKLNNHISSLKKYALKTCKKCTKTRKAPYHKTVSYKKAYKVRVSYVKKTRVAYRQKICATKNVRIAYKIPYKAKKKVYYNGSVRYKHYYNKISYYWKTVTQRVRYRVRQRYTVRVLKAYRIKYKQYYYKNYRKKVKSTCPKKKVTRYSKKVKVYYNTKCSQTRTKVVYKYKKVWVNKTVRVKYFTGKYTYTGNGCYKKQYKWRNGIKRVQVNKKYPVVVKYIVKVNCRKYRYVTRWFTKTIIVNASCYVWKTYKKKVFRYAYKTVKKYVNEYRYRYVYKYKNVSKRVRAKKTTRTYVWRTKTVRKYKYVDTYKTRIAYRYERRVINKYTTRYHYVYRVAYKYVTKYKSATKKVAVYYYNTKCTTSYKTRC